MICSVDIYELATVENIYDIILKFFLRFVGYWYFDVFCVQASNITMASTSDSQRTIAQKTWELSNNVLEIAPGEEIYKYDKQQQQQMLAAKPWEKDHHFFKDIKVLY